MKVRPYIAWYDGWFGYYYDRKRRTLYLQPFFWIGIRIDLGSKSRAE